MKYNFCIMLSEKSKRVDIYLSALFRGFSRSYIQKMIDRGQVSINGNTIKKNLKIFNRDEVNIDLKTEKTILKAEDIKLDIVYEDNDILIINKDVHTNVHPVPGENGKTGTLVNAVLYHCKEKLPTINGVERPGIVHRLDKDTTGLIMVAKNDKMMRYLQDIIQKREVDKYYIAIVNGVFKDPKFKIESFIGRHPTDKTRMTTKNPINAKIAITYGEVLGYIDGKYSVLKIKLETGRTHQIRVHLSSVGFPIIGDKVYGNEDINREVFKKYGLSRQALHSYKLKFDLYGKKVSFIGELKDDMKKIIGSL